MNRFRVEWEVQADDQLAEIWTDSADRQAITKSAHEIDRILERDPENAGIEISEGLRKLKVGPLVVTFSVDSSARMVEVARVRRSS